MHRRARGLSLRHHGLDPLRGRRGVHRAHRHPVGQPVTHHLGGHPRRQRVHHALELIPVDVEPLDRHADLTAGDEGGADRSVGQGGVHRHVGGHDGGVVAPELEHHRARRAGGRGHDGPAGGTPPVNDTMSTSRVADQHRPERGVGPVDDVQDAGRQDLGHGGGHEQDRARAGGGSLDHHGVAGQEGGQRLVAHHRHRPVERQDGGHDAVGHPLDPGRAPADVAWGQRVGHDRGEGGGHPGHGCGVEHRLHIGLAVLAGEETGQVAGFDRGHAGFRGGQHQGGPLLGGQGGPGHLRAPGGADGPVELVGRGGRRLEHDLGGPGRVGHGIGAVAP